MARISKRDAELRAKARSHGAHWALTIIREARRAGLPISLGFALVEQESNFRNVFGHDPVRNPSPKGGRVTRLRYLRYRRWRRQGLGMQGVGPCQLTWWATQDAADRIGGCWKPECNIRVAFQTLAAQIRAHGYSLGCARYNGSGPAAARYSRELRAKASRWHRVLA